MNAKIIIGIVVIAVFIVWGATAFIETTIQYVSLDEAMHAERTVQVLGKIDFDQTTYNADSSRLELTVYDDDAETPIGAKAVKVFYYGVVPGNFDQATSVVLKGKTDDSGVFIAEQMLVKCPSKYQGESTEEYQDMTEHQGGV